MVNLPKTSERDDIGGLGALVCISREFLTMTTLVWMVSAAAAAVPTAAAAAEAEPVVVGSKKFTESVILGEIVEAMIDQAGAKGVHRRQLGGTRVVWNALVGGDIDVYVEYTGTLRQEIFAERDLSTTRALRKALGARGIAMSEPLGFNNTYAIGMKREQANRLGIETISDLKKHPDLVFGFTNEILDRQDGWPGLKRAYGFDGRSVRGMDHDLAYRGLAAGDIDVVDLYSTDAEIAYRHLRVLDDDRGFFPDYQAVLLYRQDLEASAPAVVQAFSRLTGQLSEAQMTRLNKAVKVDERPEDVVAAGFLERQFGVSAQVETTTLVDRLARRTWEHLWMVLISMVAAILVAVPLGVAAARFDRLGQPILGAVGILQTLPSLALLVFMIPLFGIGNTTAIAALFLYSLLPIVRNTHAGLTSIPEDISESARALGMRPWAMLRKVELPMAMPSIFAGIKTSVVINIGVATLGALIGAGGYGQPILTGIRLDDMSLVFEGAVPAALMAVFGQLLFDGLERMVVPRALRNGPS